MTVSYTENMQSHITSDKNRYHLAADSHERNSNVSTRPRQAENPCDLNFIPIDICFIIASTRATIQSTTTKRKVKWYKPDNCNLEYRIQFHVP